LDRWHHRGDFRGVPVRLQGIDFEHGQHAALFEFVDNHRFRAASVSAGQSLGCYADSGACNTANQHSTLGLVSCAPKKTGPPIRQAPFIVLTTRGRKFLPLSWPSGARSQRHRRALSIQFPDVVRLCPHGALPAPLQTALHVFLEFEAPPARLFRRIAPDRRAQRTLGDRCARPSWLFVGLMLRCQLSWPRPQV
jgi:hypothetical protein